MDEAQLTGKLVAAINAVMSEVDYITKGGTNPEFNYKYASDEDLALAFQPALAKHGLALIPHRCSLTMTEHGESRAGTKMWRADVVQTYLLMHKDGGGAEIQVCASGVDGQDKSAPKAMTGALKYALRQSFLVPTGDDAEKPLPAGERIAASEEIATDLDMRFRDCKTMEEFKALKKELSEKADQLTDQHRGLLAGLRNQTEARLKDAQ